MKKILAGILVAFACASAGAQEQIIVAATQSLSTSGFLSYIGALAQAGSGVTVRWEPAENGQVIQLSRECGVDAILVSAPAEEEQLVRDGVGALRLRVMTGGSGEQFDVIAVNPGACPTTRLDAALKFARWITSEKGQAVIAAFSQRGGAVAYHPNAGTETCPACEAQQ